MTNLKPLRGVLTALAATTLAGGCATTRSEPSEPRIVVQEVKVPTPVPCPALAQLGPEPIYVDSDEAVRAAANVAERAKLVALGRAQRIKRLAEYAAARLACSF
jgi:hypothetical protein